MNKHRFVWHDLNTKNVEAAKKFYGEIFNWTFEGGGEKDPYVHIKAGAEMIGGIRQMGPQEHMPPSWLSYVGVDDVAATVEQVTQSGGKVHMPPTKIENAGTFAVVADPTGGVFAPWKSARPGEDAERTGFPAPFTFTWDELMSTDPATAAAFYAKVFGWSPRAVDMGGGMTYTLLDRPGVKNPKGDPASAGGIAPSPPGVPHSFWLPYVLVDDTDARCERATRLGATVTVPPMDIPGVGRFAIWMDPEQASIAILQMPAQ